MEQLQGRTAVVTGASGGIGSQIARALAREGVNLAVSGRREDALGSLATELGNLGVEAHAVAADLSDLGQVDSLIERSEAALGPIDVLVNNAGMEQTAAFTDYAREELISMVELNLTAPLLLTHRVVPGMLARGHGHVVFIASVAGKLGPPYNEPYAATKAALVGLTQSLRAEYLGQPVGFSVVSPGFVAGDGMYQRMVDEGFKSNRMMGETTTEKVAARVVEAIRRDLPEVVESGAPIRPMLALNQLAPRLIERAAPRTGVTEFFRRVAAHRGRLD
ncbi:MAG: SDR family NAD(P)-dependent oxidoreductase [Solirubrobacteraceae bacterium]|jgi:short-subunit dehydrogenase